MTAGQRSRIWAIVRLVLCVLFIALAVRGVALHDRVTLTPPPEAPADIPVKVRLVDEGPDTVTILDAAGARRTLPRSRIARDADGSEQIERGLATALRSINPYYLALALLVFAPVTLLQSLRFQLMYRAQDIRLSYWESVKLCYAGNFLNFVFLLGSTAGDVFKAYHTATHTPHKTEAVTTILLDRIVGLSGLLVVAAIMSFTGSADPLLRKLGITALVLLGGVLVALWVVGSHRGIAARVRRGMQNLLRQLPAAETTVRVMASAERLANRRGLLGGCVVIAIVLQFIAVGAGVVLAYALHMDFSGSKVWDYFAYIGSGHMIAAIPITAQGLGTMELAYKQFFLGTYGTLAQLLCLALWIRIMQLLWSLPGALVTMLGKHRLAPAAAADDAAVVR